MNQIMELNWLNYFYEVAKTQNITRASEKMRVSQPAVTKMIKQLEGALGYSLFQKTGRTIRLTSDGQNLFQVCHPIFSQLSKISSLKSEVDFESDEVIRIGASDNISNYVLPRCLKQFQSRFPNIQWNIFTGTSAEIKKRLLSGEIDSGIFYARLSIQEKQLLDEVVIGKVRFQVVYPARFGRMSSVAQFNKRGFTYIGSRMSEYLQTNAEHWIYNRLKLNVEKSIQVNSKDTQKRLVLEGLGYAILPDFMVVKELQKGKLLELKIPDEYADLIYVTRKLETLSLNTDYFMKNYFKL